MAVGARRLTAMPTDARFSRKARTPSGTLCPPPWNRQTMSPDEKASTPFSSAKPSVAVECERA